MEKANIYIFVCNWIRIQILSIWPSKSVEHLIEFKTTFYQIFTNSNNMHPDVYLCNLNCKIEFIKLLLLFLKLTLIKLSLYRSIH